MLRKHSDMVSEIRENMRGGQGAVTIENIFAPHEFKGRCRMFSKIILEPGCSIGRHEHDQEEEIYYVLSGRGLVEDNGQTCEIGPGDALKTGGGQCHSIANNGDEPLVFIAAVLLFN